MIQREAPDGTPGYLGYDEPGPVPPPRRYRAMHGLLGSDDQHRTFIVKDFRTTVALVVDIWLPPALGWERQYVNWQKDPHLDTVAVDAAIDRLLEDSRPPLLDAVEAHTIRAADHEAVFLFCSKRCHESWHGDLGEPFKRDACWPVKPPLGQSACSHCGAPVEQRQ